jgi:hypothetical protein
MTVIKPRKKDLGGNSRDFFHCECTVRRQADVCYAPKQLGI